MGILSSFVSKKKYTTFILEQLLTRNTFVLATVNSTWIKFDSTYSNYLSKLDCISISFPFGIYTHIDVFIPIHIVL